MNRPVPLSALTALARRPPVRDGFGVGLAVGFSGLAFGTTAVASGLSVLQACVLSLLTFTGASQFALVGVVAGGGNLVAGAVGALLLGFRNTLYGLRLSELLDWHGPRRALAAHGVIDETTAVALAQRGRADVRAGFTATFATLFTLWNATTLVGAVATESIGDPDVFGLDAVGPATFLALLWPRLKEGGRTLVVALLGAAIALAATPLLPPGAPVLLASIAALVALGDDGEPTASERSAR
ncbi:AzlC family ABC transporter permease [Thermobifida cellulosilytica]|uniref:Branched-chain amino acid ABC transporter permease n=1 Tax=Thermobifida cellulosilytica TB100 TaxID=665004 RepID=A0A147KL11_THECS|nr:AzlC family ABC transporter permease [Thermobifida cellulosilytica]KUP97976.1 branched-chain amino acid ABC transporter permease [Thermobifida cellulosilytica TB100]